MPCLTGAHGFGAKNKMLSMMKVSHREHYLIDCFIVFPAVSVWNKAFLDLVNKK